MNCWSLGFLAVVLVSQPVTGALAKHISSYDIKAKLNPSVHEMSGTEVLTWVNDSSDSVATLQFHLYMNAFKNEKSTFMRESGGQLRSDRFDKSKPQWGWIDVKRMQIVGGEELTSRMRFIHPDDDNSDDQTVVEVVLPQPVGPGKTIQLGIDFVTHFPQIFARTGFRKEYYLGGQWFPKIGVYEKAGFRYATKGQWNCHQFHAHSEFFSNFGRYRVELTFPTEFVVGATGVQRSRVDDPKSKTSTYVFEQEDVTDFAWTASPLFQRIERMFRSRQQVSAKELSETARLHGISEDEAKLQDVTMILLIQPEHAAQIDRHFKALEAGLKYFGLWYGKYPYQTITVVDPCYGAGGSGGMEYPTFITAGTSLHPMEDETNPEGVVIHEFGHQFWKELVATNEFEESWMDEGMNTYSTTKITDLAYGPTRLPVQLYTLPVARIFDIPKVPQVNIDRAAYLLFPVVDDMVRNSWSYYNSASYGLNSYMRPGTTLRTLENILGSEKMARIMRAYHQKWRFGHPTTDDFRDVVAAGAGRDVSSFFAQFVRGNRLLDYSVGEVTSTRIETALGVFDKGSGKITVDPPKGGEDSKKKDKSKDEYHSVVKINREGDAVWPVDVLIRFADGKEERRVWDGEYRWVKYEFARGGEIEKVVIDPDHKLLLDVNFANNSYTKKAQTELLVKWPTTLLYWAQNLMLLIGALV